MDIGIPLGSMAGAPSVIRQNIQVPVVVLAVPSGILAFLACLALLVHLDFDLDGSGGPLWQVVLFHLTMGLLLLGAVLVGWKSLPFVGGRWCLLPALLVFPLLLGIYLVEWHWAGSPFGLDEPRAFHLYTSAFALSLMVSAALGLLQLLAFLSCMGAFLLDCSWFFRLPGSSRLLSFPLSWRPAP